MTQPQFDQTSRISKRGIGSAQEQVRQIMSDLNTLEDLLRAERARLRLMAATLPPGTLEQVRTTHARLDNLVMGLLSRQVELRQLRALAQTTALINSTLDPSVVLNQVIDTVIQLTGAERGYIMLVNKATGALEFRVARNIDREQLAREDFTVSNTIVTEVFTTGLPVLTDNARSDPRYHSLDSIVGQQLRSILAVPLQVRGETIGAVYCDNKAMTAVFKESELNLLSAFANQAAVALENARLFEAARAQLAAITEMRDLSDGIFGSVASGLITLDGRDTVSAFNRAAETITFASAADVIGAPIFAVMPYLYEPLSETLRLIRQGESLSLVEIEVMLPRNGRRIWRVNASPLRGGDGSGGGVVLVLDDLTESRQRESKLAEARRYVPLALVDNLDSADFAAMGGQSREISVLFADVRGFTSFSERLEPEALMAIINRYLSVASEAINGFGGMIDKYIGDAVIGLFNTPINRLEDHPMRAVAAAVAIHRAVNTLHAELPAHERLFFRIGVHTGMAVLGNVGSQERREFTAVGDAVDLAKLLQENGEEGDVIVSAVTAQRMRAMFDSAPLTPVKTGDRPDLTTVYRVVM